MEYNDHYPLHLQENNSLLAIVDTGAQGTCITKRAAVSIGLAPAGVASMRGISGISHHPYYLFYIGFTSSRIVLSQEGKSVSDVAHILESEIQGSEFDSGGGFDVVLGMDVLGIGSLKIEGNGTFSFSF